MRGRGHNTKVRVLLIDNDDDVRSVYCMLLESYGYEVVEENGESESLRPLIENHEFDLVLLDMRLPTRDGLEILEELRSFSTPLTLPVVMFSTGKRAEDVAAALEAGANDYIHKMVEPSVLRKRLARTLESSS